MAGRRSSYLGCRRVGVSELGVGHGNAGLSGLQEPAGVALGPRAPAAALLCCIVPIDGSLEFPRGLERTKHKTTLNSST